MSLNLTESGVTVTQGRGKAKTVVLDVSFDEIKAWAKRMGKDEKEIWRKAYGRACSALKQQFQKVVANAGGVEGVPKFKDFEAFTKTLREKTGRSSPMGGVLADKRRVVAFKRNGWQVIGWPDALATWAVNFQDAVGGRSADDFLTDPKSRHRLHRLGIRDIPRTYVHNKRQVLPEPFGEHVRKNLDDWAQHVYYKMLAKEMAKGVAAS